MTWTLADEAAYQREMTRFHWWEVWFLLALAYCVIGCVIVFPLFYAVEEWKAEGRR